MCIRDSSKSANANNNSPGLAQPIYTYLHQKNPRRSSAYIYCYSIPIRFSVSTSSHSKENGGASTLEEDREEEGEEVQEASEWQENFCQGIHSSIFLSA